MANNSPTIVAASLSDDQLKKSIDSLVTHVDEAMKKMVQSTNNAVGEMEAKLKSLGNLKINSGGTNDGGASKRAKAQSAETDAIEKNIAARDKQIKKNQEAAMSFDNFSKAQQVAIRSANPSGIRNAEELQTMNIQLDLLRERLREARQQYSSFVALAAHATTTGDKGLFQYATDGVHRYEQEVRNLIPQIRTLQSGIQQMGDVIAPQGHTMQNYVNSLQKTNPELAQLNDSFKRGQSLMQNGITTTQQMANAQGELNTKTNQQKKILDEQNAYIQQNVQREQERRDAIRQTGLAARETANQLIRSAHEQASAQGNSPIMGIRELTVAVEQMRRAYFDMPASERTSPIGMALEADIKRTNEAINVIRKYNQSLMGVEQNESHRITNASTLESLKDSLKVLTSQYNKLTVAELNAGKGDALIQHFQDTTRAAQILQRTLNRPVSLKAALSGDERTLDDIAYKMQRLRAYKQGIDLTKPNAANEIKQVDEALARLQKDADKWMGKSQEMIKNNTALGRSWNYMKNRLAFYFTVGASTQFVKNLIEVRSQYEMNERALGILIDSAERGTQIFNELSSMALVSPYTLIELSTAAKQLTAYDVAAKDVVDTTRRLADMTAAVGIPVERLTYALGQIKAYGYLNARDARMFSNAGIPLVKQLSEYYSELEGRLVSTADVYDRIKKKSIDYDEVMNVIMKMTDEGGKFFDFQAKMAETLKVQLANLTLAWNNMLNEIGKSNQGLLSGGIVALKTLFLHWKDIDKIIYDVAISFGVLYAAMALSNLMFGKGTLAAIKNVAAMEGVTAANYKSVLSTAKLKASQAQFLIALNKTNVALRSQMVMMRTLSLAQAESAAKANILKTAWLGVMAAMETASAGIAAIGAAIASIAPQIAIFAAIGAIVDFGQTIKERADAIKEYNETLVRNTKESVDSINKYLGSLLYKNASELSVGDQEKAWERVREEIELSTAASELYLSTLASGNSESERINKANDLLKKISEIRGLMTEWHKEDIKITQDFHVLGIGGDGLTRDLNDFLDSYHKALESSKDGVSININETNGLAESWERVVRSISEYGEFFSHGANIPIIKQISEAVSAIAPPAWMQKYLFGGELWGLEFKGLLSSNKASAQIDMNELNDEVDEFVVSLKERLDRSKVDDPLKIREALQESLKSAGYTGEQLEVLSIISAKKLRNLYQDTYESMSEEGKAEFDKFLSSESTSVEAFFNFVKHRNASLLSGITNEELANGKWLTNERKKWLQTYLDEFLKTHAYAYDDLANMVNNMNKLTVYIPVFFQMAQTPSDVARDYESRTGIRFSTNPVVKDAKSQVEIIDKLKKAQEDAQKKYEAAQKAGGAYWENNKKTLKEENEALITQIHSYKALTKAEESANKKGSKSGGGSKKDQLLDALKQEISLVEKLQGDYDKLTKSGASQAEAIETIRGAYGKTIRLLNAQLGKYGLPQLDISQLITSKDPNKALAHFKQTLNTLVSKGLLTLERSKELEAVVEKFTLSAKTYNLDKITKGLNNELGKLKEEYELAVELDANPELGGIFADMMGLNKEQLAQMPRDFNGVVVRMQKIIDDKLGAGKFNLVGNLNKSVFESWLKANQQGTPEDDAIAKSLESIIDYVNKIRLDSSKKQIEEWNKLLEKYAEYEYKRTQIQKEAEREREVARKKGANQNIIDAINNREKQRYAQLDFEEFQKSSYWITATGDLANLSKSAIDILIQRLNAAKKSFKNLDAKQIKQLNSALSKLYKEQRKNNPFKAIGDMLQESRERVADFQREIIETEQKIQRIEILKGMGDATEEQLKELPKLKKKWQELTEAQAAAGEIDASHWVAAINETIGAVKAAIGVFDDLAKAIGGVNNSDLDKAFSVIDKAGQGAAIGAQIGGGYGAIIGAVVGAASSIISIFAGAENERITDKIKESEYRVKQLELAYVDLQHAIDKAYGMATIGAKQATIANKELQLSELKRQLALEQSRKGKDRDRDRIIEIQKQIKELEYDIKDSTDEIVNDLLGVSSVGDALESVMTNIIDTFRSGSYTLKDIMKDVETSFNDMIANMVMKMYTTKILQPWFEKQWNIIQDDIEKRVPKKIITTDTGEKEEIFLDDLIERYKESLELVKNSYGGNADDWSFEVKGLEVSKEEYISYLEELIKDLEEELQSSITPTKDDIKHYTELLRSGQPVVEENLKDIESFLRELGLLNEQKETSLSALQAGISGITEDTAGALEAITNGISQQCYLQSDLLTQIRDAVVGMDMDVQVATQAQMLLQLQQSYAVQMAIQGILEGVLVPSGRAFAVELLS